MDKRRGFGALMGAALLTFAVAGTVAAAKPAYGISVTKTADPTSVPAGGGDVTFTVSVQNTGSGFFHAVNLNDSLGGCTLAYASGDTDADGNLDTDETWSWTCTVSDVAPGTTNTVAVNACHDGSVSACNNSSHNAQGSAEVTVGLCEADCGPVDTGNGGGNGSSDLPTAPTTDMTSGSSHSAPADSAWLLIVALGVLLGSLVVLRPARSAHRR